MLNHHQKSTVFIRSKKFLCHSRFTHARRSCYDYQFLLWHLYSSISVIWNSVAMHLIISLLNSPNNYIFTIFSLRLWYLSPNKIPFLLFHPHFQHKIHFFVQAINCLSLLLQLHHHNPKSSLLCS